MLSVENDEDPNMWTVGFLTAMVAIEKFKKEIEDQKDEQAERAKKRKKANSKRIS